MHSTNDDLRGSTEGSVSSCSVARTSGSEATSDFAHPSLITTHRQTVEDAGGDGVRSGQATDLQRRSAARRRACRHGGPARRGAARVWPATAWRPTTSRAAPQPRPSREGHGGAPPAPGAGRPGGRSGSSGRATTTRSENSSRSSSGAGRRPGPSGWPPADLTTEPSGDRASCWSGLSAGAQSASKGMRLSSEGRSSPSRSPRPCRRASARLWPRHAPRSGKSTSKTSRPAAACAPPWAGAATARRAPHRAAGRSVYGGLPAGGPGPPRPHPAPARWRSRVAVGPHPTDPDPQLFELDDTSTKRRHSLQSPAFICSKTLEVKSPVQPHSSRL